MDMVSVSEFEHELRPMVTGFMPDLLPRHIIKSAVRFCKDSGAISATLNIAATEVNESINISSELVASGFDMTGLIVVGVLQITSNSNSLYIGGDYSEQDRGTITIFDNQENLVIIASLAPDRNSSMLPSELFDNWLEAILAGAAATLYLLPENQAPSAYVIHERTYVELMRKAKRWRLETLPHTPFSPTVRQRDL
jgi:hypothetical protein